jgi:AcrR family transcriptional regulator
MSPARQPPELAAEREAAILAAARGVFAANGYDGTRIQDVADAMGIAKGTVYLYFRSKDDLYWGALRDGFAELHRRSAVALAGVEGVRPKLRAYVATRLEFFEEQGDFFRVYFGEMGQALFRQGTNLTQLEGLYLEQVALLRGLVEQGIAEGTLRAIEPQSTAFSILDLVRCRVAHRLRGWSQLSADAELEDLLAFLWEGIAR